MHPRNFVQVDFRTGLDRARHNLHKGARRACRLHHVLIDVHRLDQIVGRGGRRRERACNFFVLRLSRCGAARGIQRSLIKIRAAPQIKSRAEQPNRGYTRRRCVQRLLALLRSVTRGDRGRRQIGFRRLLRELPQVKRLGCDIEESRADAQVLHYARAPDNLTFDAMTTLVETGNDRRQGVVVIQKHHRQRFIQCVKIQRRQIHARVDQLGLQHVRRFGSVRGNRTSQPADAKFTALVEGEAQAGVLRYSQQHARCGDIEPRQQAAAQHGRKIHTRHRTIRLGKLRQPRINQRRIGQRGEQIAIITPLVRGALAMHGAHKARAAIILAHLAIEQRRAIAAARMRQRIETVVFLHRVGGHPA